MSKTKSARRPAYDPKPANLEFHLALPYAHRVMAIGRVSYNSDTWRAIVARPTSNSPDCRWEFIYYSHVNQAGACHSGYYNLTEGEAWELFVAPF